MAERFYVTETEDGLFNVIDALTGGPAEVAGYLLYKMDREDAVQLRAALARDDAQVLERLDAIVKRQGKPRRGG